MFDHEYSDLELREPKQRPCQWVNDVDTIFADGTSLLSWVENHV